MIDFRLHAAQRHKLFVPPSREHRVVGGCAGVHCGPSSLVLWVQLHLHVLRAQRVAHDNTTQKQVSHTLTRMVVRPLHRRACGAARQHPRHSSTSWPCSHHPRQSCLKTQARCQRWPGKSSCGASAGSAACRQLIASATSFTFPGMNSMRKS